MPVCPWSSRWTITPARACAAQGIIANPNVPIISITAVVADFIGPTRIRRLTLSPLIRQLRARALRDGGAARVNSRHLEGREYRNTVLPHPYAFNLFSHNTRVDPETGYNEEETKVIQETRKIFGDSDIRVSATCVRCRCYAPIASL